MHERAGRFGSWGGAENNQLLPLSRGASLAVIQYRRVGISYTG